MTNNKPYQVIDSQTLKVVRAYSTQRPAYAKADQLDLEYGAIRYYVRLEVRPTDSCEACC